MLLEPGGVVWFDVVVPAGVLRAAGVGDDVGASMVWLGEHVADALGDARRRRRRPSTVGAMACSSWCPLVCFAGIGPGEVLRDGASWSASASAGRGPASASSAPCTNAGRPTGCVALLAGDLPGRRPAAGGHAAGAGGAGALPAAVAAALAR